VTGGLNKNVNIWEQEVNRLEMEMSRATTAEYKEMVEAKQTSIGTAHAQRFLPPLMHDNDRPR
jgi:hypothetical protein